MQTKIKVEDVKEARLIRAGLEDPEVRAVVKVVGTLSTLPTLRAQQRMLQFIMDYFAEEAEGLSVAGVNG